MKFVVVGHGATAFTSARRLPGCIDDSLTHEGRQHARSVGHLLKSREIDLIITSPLTTAYDTAGIIAEVLDFPLITAIVPDRHFMERNFGVLTGFTWEEMTGKIGLDLELIDRALAYNYSRFGGESHHVVRARIKEGVEDLLKQFGFLKTVLVVCHEGIIRHLVELYKPEHLGPVAIDEIHEFDFPPVAAAIS